MARVIKNIISNAGGYRGMNPASVAVSGQIKMIRDGSERYGITPKEYVLMHFSELQEQYNLTPNEPKKYLKKYEVYL